MRLLTTLAAVLLLSLPAAAAGVQIIDAYARSTGQIGASGAVFFGIENHGDTEDRLIGVASDVAERVETHTHSEDANGVMQMRHVPEGFVVPAMGMHMLDRGGDHVMLMGLTRGLAQGDVFSLTLSFAVAGEMTVEVVVDNNRVVAAGAHVGHAAP